MNSSFHILIAHARIPTLRESQYSGDLIRLENTGRLHRKRSTLSVAKQTILDENMCLIAERSIAELIKFQYQKVEARVFFQIAKETMYSNTGDKMFIIMKTGSILAQKIGEKTVRMTETGIMEKLYRHHLPKPVKQEEDKKLEKLELDSIGL